VEVSSDGRKRQREKRHRKLVMTGAEGSFDGLLNFLEQELYEAQVQRGLAGIGKYRSVQARFASVVCQCST
jgi:hypothetical protein